MDTLTELINYIVAKNNLAGEDSDIFRHILPDDPPDAITIIPYGGSSTPLFIDTSVKNFQINVRRSTRTQAYADAEAIRKSLRPLDSPFIALASMECPIEFKDMPFENGISQTNKIVYAFNISITSMN